MVFASRVTLLGESAWVLWEILHGLRPGGGIVDASQRYVRTVVALEEHLKGIEARMHALECAACPGEEVASS